MRGLGLPITYTQVKVSVDSEIASAFKNTCAASKVSMASMLSQYMANYSNITKLRLKPQPDYSTRRRRRTVIGNIVKQLYQVLDSEQDYCGRIPENLQMSS